MTRGYLSEIFASFQGEGLFVGQRHLFVRFSGCNLRCAYCDTPDSLERESEYTLYPVGGEPRLGRNPVQTGDMPRLIAPYFESGGAIDAVSLTGGEPLMQSTFLREWLATSPPPAPVMLETNGMLPEALAEVVDLIDVISMDMKLPSNTKEPEFWKQHDEFLRLARKRRLYVKVLVDDVTSAPELEQAVQLVAGVDRSIPTFVQPIVDQAGRLEASEATLVRFHAIARQALADVRVVPQVHKLIGVR